MRVCFISRRFFPAISGMSVYAINFLRELVKAGHDVTMISQYRGDPFGMSVYGGGPPPPVPGVRVIGLEALGEQAGGDFERDIDRMVETIVAEHARQPFDMLHAQYGYPNGWAALLASARLGVPNVVSIQGGDGHWVGSCCDTHFQALRRVLDHSNTTVASLLPAWSSPGRVWEGRSVDVCCGLVGLAGGMGTRTGSAQGADRTCVRPRRNTGDRRSLSRGLAVRGYAQDRLASGRAGRA